MAKMLNGPHAQTNPTLNGHAPFRFNGRAQADTAPFRQGPHNMEAEQAFFGALFLKNEVMDGVSSFLEPHHFFDPLHQQIYDTAAKVIHTG